MTDSNAANKSESNQNNTSRRKAAYNKIQNGFKPIGFRLVGFYSRMMNKKPAYLITRDGIETHYFDFSDTQTLPFDKETYSDTQLFVGNWANPWYVDIDKIEENYDDFTKVDTTTKLDDLFEENHLYPSQRWKIIANQTVLQDMFVGGRINETNIVRLLYVVAAGIGFIAILLLFGGA